MNKNIIIVGSGLTGSTLAYLHKQNGDNVKVFERRNHIGGNCYTENIGGIEVHKYGAHIFHTDNQEVWKFIIKFGNFNNYIHTVKTRLNGRMYSLPVNMNTFNEVFGITVPRSVKQEHIDKIYSMLFVEYTQKQWGMADINIDAIKRLPVRETYDNRYFSDTYQGIPKEGYTSIIKKMLDGVEVIYNSDFNTEVNDYTGADIIYHTGMIDEFMDYYLGELSYRSLDFRTEKVSIDNYQGCTVVNEAALAVPYTRTIEHKWFTPEKKTLGTVVTREYPMPWTRGRDAYYVINNSETAILYNKYKELVSIKYPNIIFCGRLGSYKYYDMDDSIKEAFELFNKNK